MKPTSTSTATPKKVYVLPADIRSQLARSDTNWTLASATADYTAYKPEIPATDKALTEYFEQAGSRYDIAPQAVFTPEQRTDEHRMIAQTVRDFVNGDGEAGEGVCPGVRNIVSGQPPCSPK